MYEIGKFMVYKFTVHCIVYSKLLIQVTSLQYIRLSTTICFFVQVTDQSVSYYTFALLTVCSSTNRRAIIPFALLLSQSVRYYIFCSAVNSHRPNSTQISSCQHLYLLKPTNFLGQLHLQFWTIRVSTLITLYDVKKRCGMAHDQTLLELY